MVSPLNSIVAGIQSPETGKDFLNSMAFAQNQAAQKQNMDIQAQQQAQNISEQDYLTALRKLKVINRMATDVKALGADQRQAYVNSLNMDMLKGVGISLDEIKSAPLDNASLDNLISQTGAVIAQAGGAKQQFGAQETLKDEKGNLFFATSKQDPSSGSMTTVLSAIDGSNAKPQGRLSIAGNYGMTAEEKVANAAQTKQAELGVEFRMRPGIEASTTAAKTGAEITTRSNLEPDLKAKIAKAEADVKTESEQQTAAKNNQVAYDLYNKGMSSLHESLSKTSTGPIAGIMPAVTTKQQTAEGATAVMAPILKQLFRQSGEGTFTKDDQAILMAMLPSRGDNIGAINAKREMIDGIVKSKLGINQNGSPKTGGQPTTTAPTQGGWSIKPLE